MVALAITLTLLAYLVHGTIHALMTKISKYDATIKLLGIVTTTLLLIPILAPAPLQLATAQENEMPPIAGPECTDAIADKVAEMASSMDSAKAIALAASHKEFKTKTQGYNAKFYTIINDFSFDANCNITLKDVHVFYHVSNAKGWVKYVIFTADHALTKVISVSEQTEKVGFDFNDQAYSGYEFWANSGATTSIYEAKGTWTQPSVSRPTHDPNACRTDLNPPKMPCGLAIWPGLHDGFPINNVLAQGGTEGRIVCNPTCTTTYQSWIQFLPNPATFCGGGSTPNPGNSITATVTNQKKTGGSNTKYNVVVHNNTSGQGCAVLNFTYSVLPEPKYSLFINERPLYTVCNPSCTTGQGTLAQFNQDTTTGTIWYSSAAHSIYEPFSSGFKNKITMVNGGNTNISVSSVTTGGRFTQSWLTSAGT